MKFERYSNAQFFVADTLDILMENEVQNNLPISFIGREAGDDWLFSAVKDDAGSIVLIAVCTPPHNVVLYETGNRPSGAAVKFLADGLRGMGYSIPGVLAEQGLARRFAEEFSNGKETRLHVSMNIMRLDKVNEIPKVAGVCRPLKEEDMFFIPYWRVAFTQDCSVEVLTLEEQIKRTKKFIGRDTFYIWEDRHPVAMAASTRGTKNGAAIAAVYTPPHYRGKGYATSVVAQLSKDLLERGNKFCCLFADALNPISCGIYSKIGYKDVCVYDEIKFIN